MTRFGAVSYLNTRPLIEGLEPLVLATPARLVERFEAGELDVALLPVAAGEAAGLQRVSGLGIASEGPVESVLLFLRSAPEAVRSLAQDPASRTSRILARILLREVWGVRPELCDPPADAELVIGDRALTRAREESRFLDLGAEWTRWCGLPFVFAAWYGALEAASELEAAYRRGRDEIPRYARESRLGLAPERLERYLRESIRFRLGPRELEGLALFLEKGRRLGLM